MWFSIWNKITEWLNSSKVKVSSVGQGQWRWLTNNYSISKTPSNAEFVLNYITCFSCSEQKWGCFSFLSSSFLFIYFFLLYRHECFTGKYTTRKIHKNYIWDPSGLFSIISHVSLSIVQWHQVCLLHCT